MGKEKPEQKKEEAVNPIGAPLKEASYRSIEKKEVSNPYVIIIKNLTDEKIYDIPLFNNRPEKLNKIQYSSGIMGVSYESIVNAFTLGFKEITIDRCLLTAYCDYHKFQRKQLDMGCEFIKEEFDGARRSIVFYFHVDAYQQQSNMSSLKQKMLFTTGVNLILPFLMPETEIRIILYPCE